MRARPARGKRVLRRLFEKLKQPKYNTMQTVYKYELQKNGTDYEAVDIPKSAKVLHIDMQRGAFVLWALVETNNCKGMRFFEIYGTGYIIPKDGRKRTFINTFMVNACEFVFHAFEVDRSHEPVKK